MMTVLRKAVELRPDLTDARLLLGFHCYNTHDYKGAIEHLGKVKKLEPERASSYFQVLSLSQLQLGNRQVAKQEADKARKSARTPTETQKAEELLKFLNEDQIQPAPVPALSSGPTSRVEGTLQGIECSSEKHKVHILADGVKQVFIIADPGKVRIEKPATLDIICGEQKGEPVTIEYTGNTDATSNVKGFVQRLEIREK
jgi:tetratricopeptide (TPR) repeat protein